MVNLGKLAKQAKRLVDKQGDKIAKGVDKATDLVDKKTKGKYRDKLDKLDDAAAKLDKSAKDEPAAAGGETEPQDVRVTRDEPDAPPPPTTPPPPA